MPQLFCPVKNDVVFWFSNKGGSKWIQEMYHQYSDIDNYEHYIALLNESKNADYENSRHFLVLRDPYKRVVSGFLFLYAKSNFYRRVNRQEPWEIKGESDALTFKRFVEVLNESEDWEDAVKRGINREHCLPQNINNNRYGKRVIDLDIFEQVWDLGNIDYEYLNGVFGREINLEKVRKQKNETRYGEYDRDKPAYELNLLELFLMEHKPNYKLFFNDEIKTLFEEAFKEDFDLCKKHGLNYEL